MKILAAVHGVEASHLSQSNLLKVRAAFVRACWSSRLTLAHTGTVLGMLDGPECVDPRGVYCLVSVPVDAAVSCLQTSGGCSGW